MSIDPPAREATRTEKVLAIVIAVLSGITTALVAYMITRHLGGTPLVSACCAGVSFGAALGIIMAIEEKLGLL
ncbi:hypothetical protein [Streptomyces sp. NPDC090135]|uniref:hypothetical protein n=1 Tax=Streptomyces sp. NPDC090135 TaxID=3365957 RepID=UPI00382A16EB